MTSIIKLGLGMRTPLHDVRQHTGITALAVDLDLRGATFDVLLGLLDEPTKLFSDLAASVRQLLDARRARIAPSRLPGGPPTSAHAVGLRWCCLAGIGVVTVIVAVLLWPRKRPEPAPAPVHSLFRGDVSDSSVTRAHVRGAAHLVDGSTTRSHFRDIDFE